MKALLDADIFIYRVGFTTQEDDINIAKWRMDELINNTLKSIGATEYQCYLTASGDTTAFRKEVYPAYKDNRTNPRPTHYQALRQYLIDNYGASVSTTIEADDAIGIDSRNTSNCIIVSIDKDLLQLPGLHYNFVKNTTQEVNELSGTRFFYKQLLMGDKADNIKGVPGIGEVKAERILNSADDYCEEAWFETVKNTYNNDEEMWRNGECLLILKQNFPAGTFSYHPLGSTLLPEMELRPLYLQRQDVDTLGVTTEEMYMDGKSLLGSSQAAAS